MTSEYPRLHGLIAVDLETRDPLLKSHGPGWCFPEGGAITDVAVAWKGGSGVWEWTPNTKRWLQDTLHDSQTHPVFHNALYDRGWLSRHGIAPRGTCHDTLTLATLLDEYRWSYTLNSLGLDYVGRGKTDEELKRELKSRGLKKDEMWRLPPEVRHRYARGDAELTLDLHRVLWELLQKEELTRIYGLEMELQPVLLAMRRRGVRVDLARASEVSKTLERNEAKFQKQLDKMAGVTVDVWAANSIAKAFDKHRLAYPRTAKTEAPSFTKAFLSSHTHPMAKLIREVRALNRTRSTFVDGYVRDHAVNGRVHCVFSPLRSDEGGAVSGRFSSSHPNLQNLPAKDQVAGKLVRGLLLPEEGQLWAACDYSQQEPRLAVHFAASINLRGARAMAQRYREDPTTDLHEVVVQLTQRERKEAKILNLAQMYGQGGAAICRALGLPTKWIWSQRQEKDIEIAGDEGQAIIDQYNAQLPFMRLLSEECQRRATRRGYIKTLLGRRCRFSLQGDRRRNYPYKAMNRLIQGSAADQTKASLVELFKAGILPLVTVHDENGLSVEDEAEARRGAAIMEECSPLLVPSKVDVALGSSWGEALE